MKMSTLSKKPLMQQIGQIEFKKFDRTELLKREIIKYLRKVDKFCKERGVSTTLYNFLNYKTNEKQYLSDSSKLLHDCPKILLDSSRSYRNFYLTLDKDFQYDIHKPNVKTLFIPANKEITNYLKQILKSDYILK